MSQGDNVLVVIAAAPLLPASKCCKVLEEKEKKKVGSAQTKFRILWNSWIWELEQQSQLSYFSFSVFLCQGNVNGTSAHLHLLTRDRGLTTVGTAHGTAQGCMCVCPSVPHFCCLVWTSEYGHGVSAQWKTCLRSFDCGDWTEGSAARFCVGEVCEGWINSVIQLPVMAYNCVALGQLFCSSASTCSEYNNFCLGFAWCTDELRLRV